MTKRAAFIIIFLALAGFATQARADQAEAREVARLNNCPPKKIEVYQQSLGAESTTVYRVDCNLPKATGETAGNRPDTLLISCDGSLCALLRPLAAEKK